MNGPLRELEAAVMALPDSERARLAEKLLASLDRDPGVAEAWTREVRQRLERYRNGELGTAPADDVMNEGREHTRSRGKARIESRPDVMVGKPVVAGTRITVEHVLEKLAARETATQVLEAHPRLTEEGIRAALAFAAEALRADVVHPG